jgi:hypothetical protein
MMPGPVDAGRLGGKIGHCRDGLRGSRILLGRSPCSMASEAGRPAWRRSGERGGEVAFGDRRRWRSGRGTTAAAW